MSERVYVRCWRYATHILRGLVRVVLGFLKWSEGVWKRVMIECWEAVGSCFWEGKREMAVEMVLLKWSLGGLEEKMRMQLSAA